MRDYPVSKAQQTILDALNLTATGHGNAEWLFENLGLVVSSKRQGRKSVPVVKVLDRMDGGFTAGGDGDIWQQYPDTNFENIQQWIEE